MGWTLGRYYKDLSSTTSARCWPQEHPPNPAKIRVTLAMPHPGCIDGVHSNKQLQQFRQSHWGKRGGGGEAGRQGKKKWKQINKEFWKKKKKSDYSWNSGKEKWDRPMKACLFPSEKPTAMNLGTKVSQSKVMNVLVCICAESKDHLKHQRLAEEIGKAPIHMG